MLIYLITSLPKLYIGEKPGISKYNFTARVHECLPEKSLADFKLLVKVDQDIQNHKDKVFNSNEIKKKYSINRENFLNIYRKSSSNFLRLWSKYSLNMGDAIVGLLCKKQQISREHALDQFFHEFDSTYKTIIKNYDSQDLGLSPRFSWFKRLHVIMQTKNLEKIERAVDLLKLQIIDSIKPYDIFHMDTLLAYYLELSILERHASFNNAVGHKMLQKMLDSITI